MGKTGLRCSFPSFSFPPVDPTFEADFQQFCLLGTDDFLLNANMRANLADPDY